jgi:hypothetical protein
VKPRRCRCYECDHPHRHCPQHGVYGGDNCPGCVEERGYSSHPTSWWAILLVGGALALYMLDIGAQVVRTLSQPPRAPVRTMSAQEAAALVAEIKRETDARIIEAHPELRPYIEARQND